MTIQEIHPAINAVLNMTSFVFLTSIVYLPLLFGMMVASGQA